ncbi:MAG: SLC13 family permease [Chloroflexi bacterium]|nr:SLC13 family permease [Chloroflexota bacterium]
MMTIEGLIVLLILIIAVALFASERWRVDFIALGVMVLLMALGVVTPREGVSGFSNPATVTIASMFVLSAGMQSTGALDALGERIVRMARNSEARLVVALMLAVGLLSAVVLNTAVVAVFIPITLKIARDSRLSPGRLLMPLSFGAMLGGTMTLIGTSTNLLVSGIASASGLPPFGMLDFAPLGVIVLVVGILYMVLVGRRLIPDRLVEDSLLDKYGVREYLSEVVVLPNSRLVGRRLDDAHLSERLDITVLDILRDGRTIKLPGASRHIRPGDVLLVRAPLEALLAVRDEAGLEILPELKLAADLFENGEDVALAEAVVAADSPLIGYSLKELNFRRRYGAVAIAIQRKGEPIYDKLGHETLMAGDMLLLLGRKKTLRELKRNPDFLLLLDVPIPLRRRRARWASVIMIGVVLVAMLGWLPVMTVALTGAFLMVVTGVLSLDEAYASLDTRVLVMLAGILSLEAAMENSGLAEWLAHQMLQVVGASSPIILIGAFYLLAMLLTEAMSNQATAVVLAPLAISTAVAMGASPTPFLMAVTFAASASFMTPVGYQTNTMIYGAGGYRFFDFTRVGAPLNLLLWIVCSVAIPFIWPLW